MFYKMIEKKRDEWLSSPDCPISSLISYMETRGQMRDAQLDAIKTYLYLKIDCDNKPLVDLFTSGHFITLDIVTLDVADSIKIFLRSNHAAAALYEYAQLKNDENEQVSKKVVEAIKKSPESIDYQVVFEKMFYGVSYTDYLFSLPMGAGKTYLMAAFIYLDLYFAQNEPENPRFAHNFIVFAPSGLKSSVIPSLKTIQRFNPSWILPEPAATKIHQMLKFEVLDQGKTANRSNKIKNPNVQKIALYQPLQELMGFIAVTNAEKVILDRITERNGQINIFEDSDDEKDRQANELRNLIGKLPGLSIFIDEVHHAVSDEIKLRAVVNHWMENETVNSVIGFSGTPYLEKAEKVKVMDGLQFSNMEITNIVNYYSLVNGIGNFLKRPTVKISNNANSLEIVEAGTRLFLDSYKNVHYQNGLTAKLGIYCGTIEKLEEVIYPAVERIVSEYGLDPNEAILKFHRGNKTHLMPVDSQMQFDSLDKTISKVRIILLVQIGKEGWDCTSLTGIILSQEGDCPTNMVLQTSCRCLRQVDKGQQESAMIYLNESNGKKLNEQLRQQHHISIKEFENPGQTMPVIINRYDRTKRLKLPKLDFSQLRVRYQTVLKNAELSIDDNIQNVINRDATRNAVFIKTQTEFTGEDNMFDKIEPDDKETGRAFANFNAWLYEIVKESFGFVNMSMLMEHQPVLTDVFQKITYLQNDLRYFSSAFRISVVNANIRKAFYEKRSFESAEEMIPESASLLHLEAFKPTVLTTEARMKDYYPDAEVVEKIILDDSGKLKLDKKKAEMLKLAEETGSVAIAEQIRREAISHPQKDRSFHYLPYKTDSGFEQTFLSEILKSTIVQEKNLEVYYNGDRNLTEFRIRCYKGGDKKWRYIGMYTPDFLILRRDKTNKIEKAIIIETKGSIYANDPVFRDKKCFVQSKFLELNKGRFDYLYLEDSLSELECLQTTYEAVSQFFKED